MMLDLIREHSRSTGAELTAESSDSDRSDGSMKRKSLH